MLPKEGRSRNEPPWGLRTAEVAKWASGSGEKHPTNALVLCPSFYRKVKEACEIISSLSAEVSKDENVLKCSLSLTLGLEKKKKS